MTDPESFHRIDLLRVALQVRGAQPPEIELIIAGLKALAKSPEAFERWNRYLDQKETQLLGFMLTPKGEPFSRQFLTIFRDSMITKLHISEEEIEQWWRPIRDKLN